MSILAHYELHNLTPVIYRIRNMMLTILQLLSDGADPSQVRCPQTALYIATVSGCPDLVRHLINYGADVNEVLLQVLTQSTINLVQPQLLRQVFIYLIYEFQSLNYTALDLAVSRPLTFDNIDLVRVLLECGAKTGHRLRYEHPDTADPTVPELPGPTLLHAVLARKTENDTEEEVNTNQRYRG